MGLLPCVFKMSGMKSAQIQRRPSGKMFEWPKASPPMFKLATPSIARKLVPESTSTVRRFPSLFLEFCLMAMSRWSTLRLHPSMHKKRALGNEQRLVNVALESSLNIKHE